MELQDTLFIWFNVSIVVMFIMGCFLYKYYPSFHYKDKLIIEYLRLVFMLAIVIYLMATYKFDHPILVFIPAGFIHAIYQIVRLHKSKGEQLYPSINDKKVIAWVQIATSIIGITYVVAINDRFFATYFVLFAVYFFISIKKLFDSRKQTLSDR